MTPKTQDPLTKGTAWLIYANALELLASTFAFSIVLSLIGAIVAGSAFDGDSSALTIGLLAGVFAWPIAFGLRSRDIKRWVERTEADETATSAE